MPDLLVSPSPANLNLNPVSIPSGIFTSKFLSTFTTPFPWHFEQNSVIVFPEP